METRNSRKSAAMQDLGIEQLDEQRCIADARQKEEARKLVKERRKQEIEESVSYKMTKGIATAMDKWYLDPILGFVPGIGDILPSIVVLPSIYVSLFKVKSIPLTLAILFNILKDILLGMIPFYIGNVIDIFNKAYMQNMRLIVGYVEDDKTVIDEVNRKAVWSSVFIVIFVTLIWLMVRLVASIAEWIGNLF